MKKLDLKSIILGFAMGTIGISTVFAANGIKSAALSNAAVTLDGAAVPLEQPLVSIVKGSEKDAKLYLPVREFFEYAGYKVEFDSISSRLTLSSPEYIATIPDPAPDLNEKSATFLNTIPEHVTFGGNINPSVESDVYTYEGVIGADQYLLGNPIAATEGDNLTFRLNTLEYVSGEAMEEDEAVLRIIYDGNDEMSPLGFNLAPRGIYVLPGSFKVSETANYPITVLNISGKEVKFSFTASSEYWGS